MVIYGTPDEVVKIDLDVPSGTLRTDKQIDWTLEDGGEMSLTVHFDLSQSIVQVGEEYKLKPVLHLFDNNPQEAATICGTIDAGTFVGGPPETIEDIKVSVVRDWIDGGLPYSETYTVVTVSRESETAPTPFCIYWLVPLEKDESYTVQVTKGAVTVDNEVVAYPELGPGGNFELNKGAGITIP